MIDTPEGISAPVATPASDAAPSSPPGLRPVDPAVRALWNKERIADQLPIAFESGIEVSAFMGFCARCDAEIAQDHLRGEIDRALPQVAQVNAAGFCPGCRCLTPYFWRVYDDGRVLALHGTMESARWTSLGNVVEPPSRMTRIRAALLAQLRRLFG